MKKKRAITTLAIGPKYAELFRKREPDLAALANRCDADLVCIQSPLDEALLRPLLCQKLLLPDKLKSYDEILFLDLDVFFRHDIPNPFDIFEPGAGLAAVLQPRETKLYADVATHFWRRPEIAWNKKAAYFTEQGMPDAAGLEGPVNGGVWMCRPALLGELYRDAYYDVNKWRWRARHEEPLLAWLPQSMGIFQALPFEYNAQLCFAMFQPANIHLGRRFTRPWRIALRALIKRHPSMGFLKGIAGYDAEYEKFAMRCIEQNVFVHFSGDMHMFF